MIVFNFLYWLTIVLLVGTSMWMAGQGLTLLIVIALNKFYGPK